MHHEPTRPLCKFHTLGSARNCIVLLCSCPLFFDYCLVSPDLNRKRAENILEHCLRNFTAIPHFPASKKRKEKLCEAFIGLVTNRSTDSRRGLYNLSLKAANDTLNQVLTLIAGLCLVRIG